MPMGTLVGAIQAFQQSSDWMGRLRQEQEKHRAIAALGRAGPMSDDAPQAGPKGAPDPGMSMDQSAGAAQNAQQVGQLAGWPQQAGPGGAMAPNAVPYSPGGSAPIPPHVIAGLRAMMQGGGQQQPMGQQQGQQQPMGQQQGQQQPLGQPPQMPVPGAPAMAQPRPAGPPPPDPNLSSTAQPDAAGMQNLNAQASQTINAIRQSIKMGSPKIDDYTLALAVQMQIENIKGVSPLTKAFAQGQIQYAVAAQKTQMQMATLQERTSNHLNRLQEIHDSNQEKAWKDRASQEETVRWHNEQGTLKEEGYAVSERNTAARDQTSRDNTAARDQTSRDNNTANNDQRDRSSDKSSAARRSASESQAYTQARNAFLKKHPNDVNGAQAFARKAVNDIQAGTTPSPSSNVPSGDPLAGRPAAPRGGGQTRSARSGPVRVQSAADVARLSKGARFVAPDGVERVKN